VKTVVSPTRRRARIAAALWGGFLFLLTSWPNPPAIPAGSFPLDRLVHFLLYGLVHFLLYGVEAFLLYRAIDWKGRSGFAWPRVLAIVGTMALWGVLDEAHQEWIPGRGMESEDLAADIAGAGVGAIAAGMAARPKPTA
jgi:VanZ family protein